ncbi:MAG: TraR/DksA C4-type zinc finger protein [Rhodobacteraceae bacterium]|nr:TraR/DksA C4-type zinc finger protein [Paracoccaceae bacterium]
MPEPSDDDLHERYRPRLVEEAVELDAASGITTADRRPVKLDQQSVGRLSRMDALQQQAMAVAQEARRRARMTAIDAALRRLDAGEFGWCTHCGEFIGIKRLDLDPALMRCVDCAR